MRESYVSVIVPIYNVEEYIKKCVVSLLEQTLDNIEYIFIDDKSTDNSIRYLHETIALYEKGKFNIKIFQNNKNMGSAISRNIGLGYATGEYIAWVDADDWIEVDMLDRMYSEAKRKDVDMLWTDYWECYENEEHYCNYNGETSIAALLDNIILEKIKAPLWNKLFRLKLIQRYAIQFLPHADMAEDRNFCIKVLGVASDIVYMPSAFYHYNRNNKGSLTQEKIERHGLGYIVNAIDATTFLLKNTTWLDYSERIKYQLIAKKNYLHYKDIDYYKRWSEVFPEVNKNIFDCKGLHNKHKIIGWFAAHKMWNVLRLILLIRQ